MGSQLDLDDVAADHPLALQQLHDLRTQLAEAQRDSERLDWIEKQTYVGAGPQGNEWMVGWKGHSMHGLDFRSAIDAAKGDTMRDISKLLFNDLKSDEEKSAFFLSGRAYETGVVASAIQNELAMAYHRIVELKKELAKAQRDSERYHFLAGFGVTAHSPRWAHWRIERWTKDGWEPIYGNLMNAAIDAAMGETS